MENVKGQGNVVKLIKEKIRLIRLSQPSGEIFGKEDPSDSDSKIVRSAILVHAGKFMSGDGPIEFDEARIKRVVAVHNFRLEKLAKDYGGMDKIPMGAYEPILDSHADESNDKVIGRLTGPLEFQKRDIPKVGKNIPCAVAVPGITFLGKSNVEKVNDGRIYHLSIGINEKDDSLGETSTVVEPAAAGAMLLSQGKQKKDNGGSKMSVDLKRMKAHTERLSRLAQINEKLTTLVSQTTETQKQMKLAEKKGNITHRLKALCQSAKMTPAEYKALVEGDKLTRMAAMDQDNLEMALSMWESRQAPVVQLGQHGSTSAGDVMEFGKRLAEQKDQAEYKRLRSETKSDFIKMAAGKKLSFKDEDKDEKDMSGPVEKPVAPGKDDHAVPGQQGDEKQLAHHMEEMAKHLAAGDVAGAKECHAKMSQAMSKGMKHMSEYSGDVKSEDQQAHMAAVQGQVDELKTQMARMAGMVQEMMGAEQEEGKHFGQISKEHGEVQQA